MMECLKLSGNVPDERDALTILAIMGTNAFEHRLTNDVGMG